MLKHILCALLLLTFTALPAAAESKGQPIGTVSALEGQALVTNAKADIGTPVHMNDLIETQESARLRIEFLDGTELTLGEKSILTVDDYVYMPSDESVKGKAHFSILRGPFLYISGLISKNDDPDVQFKTPYGSIGIRGTKFWGGLLDRSHVYDTADRMGGSTEEFGVYVETGEVVFKTNRGQSIVREGYGSFAKDIDSVPSSPKIWSDVDISMALKQVTFSGEQQPE